MIFVSGYGQMCNNILQFGHLYAWGRVRGVSVIGLRFCYKYKYFNISKTKYYNWLTYLFAKYAAKLRMIPVVSFDEEKKITQEIILQLQKERFILVNGWEFRDYNAFIAFKKEIKSLFSFRPEIIKKVNSRLSSLKENIIRLGVHIRRGDYKVWKNGRYYYSDEDYIRFIQTFCALFHNIPIEILIVSNEKTKSQEKFKAALMKPLFFLSGNPGEDLYALSTCNYIIGPPSTFSLIASFYNDSNLYWVFDKNHALEKDSFRKFDELFRQII